MSTSQALAQIVHPRAAQIFLLLRRFYVLLRGQFHHLSGSSDSSRILETQQLLHAPNSYDTNLSVTLLW